MPANKILLPLFLALLLGTAALAEPPHGVVEMFDFDGNYGTLTRASVGVPRAKPSPALDAIARWRASAEAFTHGFAVSRGANGTESFKTRRVYEDEIGQAHVRLSQTIAGLPVVGAELIVHAEFQTGNVLGVNGRFAIDRGLPRASRINASDALAAAMREYRLTMARIEGAPELTYVIDNADEIRLAWTNFASYVSENGYELDRIYADALTGAAIARHPQVRRIKNREMYDCRDQMTSWNNCVFMFSDSQFTPFDAKAIAAYDNAGIAWDYFASRHGRDGMDGNGIVLKQGINWGINRTCCGGWWPPGAYDSIVYTDNQGSYSAAEGNSLDIVGHEFTHGVIHYEPNLPHTGEQAAIDEGLADIFAIAIDAYRDGAPDWWLAEDIYSAGVPGDAMRYLDDPARRRNYADYYPARVPGEDHENAGITGLAFYLLSEGGSHPRRPSVSVAKQGIDKAERIFYETVVSYMTSSTNFYRLEGLMLKAASFLYGFQSPTYNAVANAWIAVGNHWDVFGSNPPLGASRWTPEYTTVSSATHTGQLSGTDFDLFLEKSADGGVTWTTYASSTGTAAKKILEVDPSPGTYRWRVYKARGSGSLTLFELVYNHPR